MSDLGISVGRVERGASAWGNLSGVVALFGVTLRRLCRGQRLWLGLISGLVPTAIVLIARSQGEDVSDGKAEGALVFLMMAQMLVPMMALWLASGLVQDEVEEQTLTYLLLRPLPRPLIYLTKLAAATLLSCVLAAFSTVLVELAMHWDDPEGPWRIAFDRGGRIAGAFALALLAYNAVFGLLGLVMKKPQGVGVLYILLLEGVFANIDFLFRRVTILYYARVLMLRWLGGPAPGGRLELNLDLATAPTVAECVLTLVLTAAVVAAIGGAVFAAREFKVKTPETA